MDASDDSLRNKINDLVTRLPASFVYSLLSEIEGMDGEPVERVQLVRQYVIEYLNRQRTNRARRLFTTLFEPFIIEDDALYHAGVAVPGMVQRVDVGALWEALSRDAFPLLAVEAQERLDEMARGEVIDRALRSPAAADLMERMRAAAVKHLDGVLTNRKALDDTLAALSRNRTRRTRLLSAYLDKAPPFEAGTVQVMRDILSNAKGPIPAVADALKAVPSPTAPAAEQRRCATALLRAADDLTERHADHPWVALLLPLSVLHVKRNYAVMAHFIRDGAVDAARGNPITDAMAAHFLATVRALVAALTAVLKLTERAPGTPIRPGAKEKARIDALMHRLALLIDAVLAAGLMEDRRSEPVFGNGWAAAAKLIASRVAPVALERAGHAAAARLEPAPDHAEALWLVRLLAAWHEHARTFGFETYDLVTWRETLLEEMRVNVVRALAFEEGEPLEERLAHLLRINAFTAVFDQRTGDWLSDGNPNAARLAAHLDARAAATTAEERDALAL